MTTRTFHELLRATRHDAWDPASLPAPGDAPMLPESLARLGGLAFLDDSERRTLDRIRAHSYLATIAATELPLARAVAADARALDAGAAAAMAQVAVDERRHAALLGDAAATVVRLVGVRCHLVAPPTPPRTPLARALALLHLDTATVGHHLECHRDATHLDPWFAGVLRLHWSEEVQHALVGERLVAELARRATAGERDAAVDGYLDSVAAAAGGLVLQVAYDLDAFARATGRRLGAREHARFVAVQHAAYRSTYLGSALAHPALGTAIAELSPSRRDRLAASASACL